MEGSMKTPLVIASLLVSGTAFAAWKEGDRVLAMRSGTNSFFAATVKHVEAEPELGKTSSVTFDDGTVQEYGPITWDASIRAFDWKAGSPLECSPDAATTAGVGDEDSPQLTAGTVASIDKTSVELSAGGKQSKFPLAACRYRRTWWDELSEHWRNYASYKTAKGMPAAGARSPAPNEIQSAFSFYLESADGGAYIAIKKCVATGSGWIKMNSGSELTARTIDVACAIAVPLPPKPRENFTCMIEYGTCRQPYQGNNEYGACEWKYASRDPEQVSCGAVK
jgi:hypothetical protein